MRARWRRASGWQEWSHQPAETHGCMVHTVQINVMNKVQLQRVGLQIPPPWQPSCLSTLSTVDKLISTWADHFSYTQVILYAETLSVVHVFFDITSNTLSKEIMESNKLYERLCFISSVRGKQKLQLNQQQRGIHMRFDKHSIPRLLYRDQLCFTQHRFQVWERYRKDSIRLYKGCN